MRDQISPLVRAFAALALLAGLLFMMFNFAANPLVQTWNTLDTETRSLREQAGEMRALAASTSASRNIADQSERTLLEIGYLPGDTEAVQLANLQTKINGIVRRGGLRLQSTRTLAMTRREGVGMIGLQAVVQTDITRLRNLLLSLETAAPRLLVDGLAITPVNRSNSAAPDEDLLNVDMRILAAVRETRRAVR